MEGWGGGGSGPGVYNPKGALGTVSGALGVAPERRRPILNGWWALCTVRMAADNACPARAGDPLRAEVHF